MPDAVNPPEDLDLNQARFLLAQVADQFCDLYMQEKKASDENISEGKIRSYFVKSKFMVIILLSFV